MYTALIPGKETAWFFHFYQKIHVADIVFTYRQPKTAVLRKEMRNRGVQESTQFNQVKKRDLNNDARLPASGCITIIRASEIAIGIDKFGLVLKVAIQHGSGLLFLNIQDKAR
jgi:hypothetical protein